MTTWLEIIAANRAELIERAAHEDAIADGLYEAGLADDGLPGGIPCNLTPWGDDLGPLPDDEDESWRDEPEADLY